MENRRLSRPSPATSCASRIPSRRESATSQQGTRADNTEDPADAEAPVEMSDLGTSGLAYAYSRDRASATLQFAEHDPCAAPEVVRAAGGDAGSAASATGDALGAAKIQPGLPAAGAGNDAALHAAQSAQMSHMPRQGRACPSLVVRWVRQKPYLAAAAAAFGIGVLALIVLPIVLHHLSATGAARSQPPSVTPPPPDCSSCSTASPSASAVPPTVVEPNATRCLHNATWTSNVSFMGVAASVGKPWPYRLFSTPTATDCCTMCFGQFPDGCQGWAFLPWDNTPVPCTIIYGWNGTAGVSTMCPHGEAQIAFATDPSRTGSMGDAGPCGSTNP